MARVNDTACAGMSAAMALAAEALLAQAIAQGSRDDISLLWAQRQAPQPGPMPQPAGGAGHAV